MDINKLLKKGNKLKKIRYGNENYVNINKTKQTWIKNYGVDNPWKNKDIINKMHQTKLNNIDENGLNSYQRSIKKGKQTKKLRYGDENYNNINKIEITMFNKYNVKSYAQSNRFKNLFKNKEWLNKLLDNQYQTKKKNHTFKVSQQEENIYNLLLQKFGKEDIIRQYKNKLYPFNCDFYIKSLDLYIEYHGTWTHGYKPFKNSVEDLQKLEKLKKKNSDYYNNMIYTWTNLDVRKLQIFKKNKLNYKIFYNMKQFKNWFNNLNLK